MEKVITLIFAVLLSVTVSLSAQEKSVTGSRAPNPAAFNDLLKEVKPAGPKAVNSSRSAARPKPIQLKSAPAPKTAKAAIQEDALEIDRVLAEARMHLSRIREESTEEEARNVFDEAIEFITLRLANLKEKSGKAEIDKKVSTGKTATPVAGKSSDDAEQPPRVETKETEVAPGALPEGRSASGKVATSSTSPLLRWAERLRALADELEAETNSSESTED